MFAGAQWEMLCTCMYEHCCNCLHSITSTLTLTPSGRDIPTHTLQQTSWTSSSQWVVGVVTWLGGRG